MKEISSALQEYFRLNKVSQDDIAKLLGVSQAYVSGLLTGKKAFGKKQAQKFAELFGLSPSWLLTGEGEMLVKSNDDNQGEPVYKRLADFLNNENIGFSDFETVCGLPEGWVNSVKDWVSFSTISVIKVQYPQINLNWLFTGEGEMYQTHSIYPVGDKSSYPTNDVHHNQQVVMIANLNDVRSVFEDVIKEQMAKKK